MVDPTARRASCQIPEDLSLESQLFATSASASSSADTYACIDSTACAPRQSKPLEEFITFLRGTPGLSLDENVQAMFATDGEQL